MAIIKGLNDFSVLMSHNMAFLSPAFSKHVSAETHSGKQIHWLAIMGCF